MSENAPSRGRRSRRGTTHSSFYRRTQEQSRALYHCNYCHKDISDNVRIKCADCPDFDLCVECFSVGVEVNGHRNSHSYRVMDNLSFPIFHPSWGSDEELLLLEAVDMYGPGNWAAVAEHVGTKSKEACQQHYFQIYIYPPSCPLPTPAPEMAGLDVRELAAIARSSCGRKRMRLDPGDLQQQSKQPQQQQQESGTAQPQQAANGPQEPLEVKQEAGTDASKPPQSAAAAAAAAGVFGQEATAAGGEQVEVVKWEEQQQQQLPTHEQQEQEQQPLSQQTDKVHGKGAKRRRDSEVSAAAAAAAAAAEQQRAAHPAAGGLSKHHPQQAAKHPPDQKAAGGTATGDAAAAAGGGGGGGVGGGAAGVGLGPVGLGPSAAAVAAAPAGGVEHPRVRGSGPQLDMMTGWHSKRFEFEPEWDNDAEVSIAELEFKETDSPEEVQAKLRLLEIYNKRLDERARRQSFILDHGLLNVRKMQGLDRRRMAGEKERFAQMRVFARYQPPGSHEGLVEGLLVEGRLRMRIAELQAHRAAGRRTMAEIEDAEIEAASEAKRKGNKGAADDAGPTASGATGLGGYRSTASALNVWRQRRGVGLDILGLPGVERLSAREAELCAHARLLPAHYLSLKDVMMRDAKVHGHISRNDARGFFRLDPARSARVWELLCSSGWLSGNSPEEAEDKRRWARGGGGKRSEPASATAAAVEGCGEEAAGADAAAAAVPNGAAVEGPDASATVGLGEDVETFQRGYAVVEQEAAAASAGAAVGSTG